MGRHSEHDAGDREEQPEAQCDPHPDAHADPPLTGYLGTAT
jgi:hypothetical protein